MPNLVQSSFLAGALPDSLHGRIDSDLYKQGLARARNWNVTPQGSLQKRNGISYVWSIPLSEDAFSVKWVPYRFGDGHSMALLLTNSHIYAFLQGAKVRGSDGETPARVNTNRWTEHTEDDPQTNIRYVQIGSKIYFTRPTKPVSILTVTSEDDGDLTMNWAPMTFSNGNQPRIILGQEKETG